MSKSLIKFAKELLAPKVIVDTLRNQDSKELGEDTADAVKKFIVNEFGDKGGRKLIEALQPWFNRYYLAFIKRLYED